MGYDEDKSIETSTTIDRDLPPAFSVCFPKKGSTPAAAIALVELSQVYVGNRDPLLEKCISGHGSPALLIPAPCLFSEQEIRSEPRGEFLTVWGYEICCVHSRRIRGGLRLWLVRTSANRNLLFETYCWDDYQEPLKAFWNKENF